MTSFSDLGLTEAILKALTAEGYTSPTPIQSEVIPALLAGADVLGTAQTGTGKTAAFVLPILDRLARQRRLPLPHGCQALILVPTRELAAQVAQSVRSYGRYSKVSTAVIVGGVRPGPQIKALAAGVDVVIATPGRLLDHLKSGVIGLEKTQYVVLDEADQMLDLGFLPGIRRILSALPRTRQSALLSATMPPEIRRLSREMLRAPREIAVAPVSRPIEAIDQRVAHVEQSEKRQLLVRTLNNPDVDRAIVFTRTKRGADRVALFLQKAGLDCGALHGNKSQGQRERTMAAFRAGNLRFLVATDIAARGIDIDDISHVINFELPNVPESYVHRIGRTARAGREGTAISFCDASERPFLSQIERLIGRRLSGQREAGAPADVPAGPPRATETRKKQSRRKSSRPAVKPQGQAMIGRPGEAPGESNEAGLTRMLGQAPQPASPGSRTAGPVGLGTVQD